VRDQVQSHLDLTFEPIGSLTLKNIPHPVEAYVVHLDSTPSGRTRRARAKLFASLAGLLRVAAAGTGWWLSRGAGTLPGVSQVPPTSPSPNAQADALLNVGLSSAPPLSLVVLPFENTGEGAADNYLATGITDDLTTELSHIPVAFVISRATAYTYHRKTEDIRRIGRDLGVRYVVRGSVQRFGQVLRINAELGSTETGALLWSERFNQQIDDLAGAQDQIVSRMRFALNVSLVDIEAARSLRERPTNPNAFDLILRARAVHLLPGTKNTSSQARSFFEQALQRDPDSVAALTGAANAALNEIYYGVVPYDIGIDRARQYVERAQELQPNAEQVLYAQASLLAHQLDGLDYERVRHELETVLKPFVEYYPNNPSLYHLLGILQRNQGRHDEAVNSFTKVMRLNPRTPSIKNLYWNLAYSAVYGGHDREGLEWADRALAAAGTLPLVRVEAMLASRAVAAYRTGDVKTAERLAKELNGQFPFHTWRLHSPHNPDSDTNRRQIESFQRGLRAAGGRDHLDPNADCGVTPDDALHEDLPGKTPTAAPGVTTVSTEQLSRMLENEKPQVIDTMSRSWYRSVSGAVGLNFNGNTQGTFDDAKQRRLKAKMLELTGGNMSAPTVAMSFNVSFFDGYNLALRLRHMGYTNVFWYRGGREAWEVAGKPEAEVRPADW
jgi:TolB-like protein